MYFPVCTKCIVPPERIVEVQLSRCFVCGEMKTCIIYCTDIEYIKERTFTNYRLQER